MKPQLTGTKKHPSMSKPDGAEAALSLQEELVAAIHGAFEVAVQIAVREVKKLVGQTAGDMYEEMRRENESLKQRLQRAEAMLDSARMKESGGSLTLTKRLFNASKHTDQPPHHKCFQIRVSPKVAGVHNGRGIRGDAPPASHIRAQQPADPRDKHVSRNEGGENKTQLVSDTSDPEEKRNNGCIKEVTEEISRVCVVKVESITWPCQDSTAQDSHVAPLPCTDEKSTLEQVAVKQEKPEEEEERDGSACCLESIKVEDFSVGSMSEVQTKMLEEWEPEVLDTQCQDPDTQLSCTGLAKAHPPNVATHLPPPTELPSLSSEFPIFQIAEPAPIPEAPRQIYGVHVRTSRNLSHTTGNLFACKSCGQTFHLPSLLRRHCGQCPQKLQQRCQQPVAGSKRTRLQLYPPGCSPFRCSECNREFNRMENLKTHLRIHTGERPYTCSVCSKCFRHSGALTRHFRIHTGEKPYICGQCGKSFRNCGGLKFHQRSHSKQLQ